MPISSDTSTAQSPGTQPGRPPNYLVRSIIFLLVLSPICLLIGVSSLVTTWNILTGPPVRSETPASMRVLFELLRVISATIGFFIPIAGIVQALKVNREFDAGNYGEASKASKTTAQRCRESLILLVLMLIIMAVDLLTYFSSLKN